MKLLPNWVDAYYGLSVAYQNARMWPEALEAIGKAIEIDPSVGDFYRQRGLIHLSSGRWQDAAGDFNAAADRGTSDVYTSLWLWMTDMHQEKEEEAKKPISAAVSRSKAGSWEGMLLRYHAGDIEPNVFLEAASTNERKCEAYYYIAQRLRFQEGKEEPREWLQKCRHRGNAVRGVSTRQDRAGAAVIRIAECHALAKREHVQGYHVRHISEASAQV
ncbi:MAG: hypothetical protein JSU63_15265 [Phycisphaerales bacterium]|nr:MAG: hypothetical protein JSU63_15265 [Phycisphaerales bacterium]